VKTQKSLEYEVTPLDEYGDVIEVLFFSNKKQAETAFSASAAPCQLWRVTHTATVTGDGLPIDTDRHESLIAEKN